MPCVQRTYKIRSVSLVAIGDERTDLSNRDRKERDKETFFIIPIALHRMPFNILYTIHYHTATYTHTHTSVHTQCVFVYRHCC